MATKQETEQLRGQLLEAEPMSRHTSWRVGGKADRYYKPADLQDLSLFLSKVQENEEITWVGLGSNLLVRDGGIRGTVIATSGCLNVMELKEPDLVRAEAGVASAKVARFCATQNLAGAEFLAGIPGTFGGALAMNAGAFGGETWSVIEAVETIDRHGKIRVRQVTEFVVGYRTVKKPEDEWFVAGYLRLPKGDSATGKAKIKSLLEKRGATQPTQLPNAGSVFKNPDKDHAARLIEASGLKGSCEGKACVSEMHANFIINTGDATADDIERLIYRIQATVERLQHVRLEPEVRIVGQLL